MWRILLTYEWRIWNKHDGQINIFFLGLQIKQCKDGISINQSKYVNELLKKYKMDQAKHARTSMATNEKLDTDKDD